MTEADQRITNWLGQIIRPGTIVGRGARDGNSSSFKMGKVLSITGRKVRVQWEARPDRVYSRTDTGYVGKDVVSAVKGAGSPDVDSLFVLDPSTFNFELYQRES